MSRVSSLVSSQWLMQQLASRSAPLRVLDASWTALKGGRSDYLSARIPSAGFFDLNHCVRAQPTLPRALPDVACFRDYARSLGVDKQSHLVVYDRGGMLAAARTWWTFKAYGQENVSVLDGGLRKWQSDGYDVASEQEKEAGTKKGDFDVDAKTDLMKSFEDMVKTVRTESAQILDARRPEHFFGEEVEPTAFTVKALQGMEQPIPKTLQRGHMPGSISMLEDLVINQETKCLLDKEELLKLFRDFGVDLARPLVTTCYNGHAATLLALAAAVCGKTDTSVYYGSWTEWGQRASGDLVVGPGNNKPASAG